MILATDTHYTETVARTAGVLFSKWTDEEPVSTHIVESTEVADYEPGSFYKRELPLILKLLDTVTPEPSTVVIDGYVQLDEDGRKGLGAHLFESLYVTAAGVDKEEAADCIRSMHGEFRQPTLLKRVDRLCRDGEP